MLCLVFYNFYFINFFNGFVRLVLWLFNFIEIKFWGGFRSLVKVRVRREFGCVDVGVFVFFLGLISLLKIIYLSYLFINIECIICVI